MSQEELEHARGTRIVLRPLSESASRRRTLDERLVVRFPALYRLLAARVMRLPPSRLRSLAVARVVARAYAAANRRDFELLLVGIDPGHEYRPAPEMMPPDLGGPTQGHDGYLRMWRYWLDAFDDIRYEPEEVLDLGAKLLVTVQQRGHGSGSGVAVSDPVFQLLTIRRGATVRQEDFRDRSDALEAAGPSE
jgi:hypothetical protein